MASSQLSHTQQPRQYGTPLLPTPTPVSPTDKRPATKSPQSANSKATHICDQCSRAFTRAEHLERHQTTHLPSNATKSFVCNACGKGFTRKDVLTRHIRAVHETKKLDVRKSRRKSCRRCASFKIKCTGGGKGKESGERAEEPCEACKKREVECIYDFGASIEKSDSQGDNADDLLDFGSDGGPSEVETASSEYSTKRRKTSHPSGPGSMFLTPSGSTSASAVSPHLLSAARLASSETSRLESVGGAMQHQMVGLAPQQQQQSSHGAGSRPAELSSADELVSLATLKTYEIPNLTSFLAPNRNNSQSFERGLVDPSRISQTNVPACMGSNGERNFMSHLFFPPIRNSPPTAGQKQPSSTSVADEDLNAANTLQGINSASSSSHDHFQFLNSAPHGETAQPHGKDAKTATTIGVAPTSRLMGIDMVGGIPRTFVPDYSNTNLGFGRASHSPSGGQTTRQNIPLTDVSVGSAVTSGLDPSLGLHEEDNFYFDFEIFDNSTDWLRDWGGNATTSPESQSGLDAVNEALGVALTRGTLSTAAEVPSLTSTTNSTRDVASPKSAPSDDGAGYNPRPPPPPGEDTGVPGLPIVSPLREHNSGADFLPWKWLAPRLEESNRTVTLPPLRLLLTECNSKDTRTRYSSTPEGAPLFEEVGTITEEMRNEMISVLSLPSTRPPYPEMDGNIHTHFPNKELIADFIKLYFKNFHPILPVIHRPSFCIERCPSTVLIAMVSIGASYSDLKNAKGFADALSELCKRCLSWMAENNPGYARSAFYLQSLCLQNLYAMGSGSTSLYDAADVSRSILIGNSRRIGLFSGELSPCPSSPSSPRPSHHSLPDDDLDSQWRAWRESEGVKRLAWSIFEYDSSFSTLSNRRGAITLSDISIRIPCSESLWEAPTAVAWHSLLTAASLSSSSSSSSSSSDAYPTRGLPFYHTLQAVIGGRLDPRGLTSWGKRICAQAMGRMMWDFKELEESVLTVSINAASSFRPAKEKLLESLMRVCCSSTSTAGEVENDRYHWVLARLIAHYTHLHAAFPSVSRMLNLARKPPASAADPRIKKLKSSFAANPVEARSLAYHAAQIIALSRWRPVFSPAEGMRLFLAGVVLWGFGNYYRPSSSTPPPGTHPSAIPSPGHQEDVVRLDLLPWYSPCGGRGYEEWIRGGKGKATIGMGGDGGGIGGGDRMMEVCGEDGAREVLKVVVGILGSLRVWGLGGEFKRVLEELGGGSKQ